MNKGPFRATKQELDVTIVCETYENSVYGPSFGMGYPWVPREGDEGHLGMLGLENKDGWSDHMLGKSKVLLKQSKCWSKNGAKCKS